MEHSLQEVESFKLFSESLIWQLNRDYYKKAGIGAWSDDIVPHHMTSNSMVGKTYAELILGLLKDLAAKGKTEETVYIVELGAGHGRLAFHILKHLEISLSRLDTKVPPYCYIISDIVEENLLFFKNQLQLLPYYKAGTLDYAFYDAINGQELHLRYTDQLIKAGHLSQPIVAIGNYFFDSIPTDLFHISDGQLSACSVALSSMAPVSTNDEIHLKDLSLSFKESPVQGDFYSSEAINNLLNDYKSTLIESYVFRLRMLP